MRSQFGHFLSLSVPHMQKTIFTTRKHKIGVRSERAFDDGGLIEETGKFVDLVTLESIQKNYAVVSCRQNYDFPTAAELHDLDLI